jgi:HK97 gp10 family phage protein
MSVTITGIQELTRMLERGARAPARVLTKATKDGAMIVRQQARADSPVDTGLLRRSIKLKSERRRVGKKVYQVKFIGDNLAKVGANGSRSFYPASQEYGWKKRDGSKTQGKHFLEKAIQQNKTLIKQTVVDGLVDSLRVLGW